MLDKIIFLMIIKKERFLFVLFSKKRIFVA